MDAWIDRLAETLGEESPSETETTRLLGVVARRRPPRRAQDHAARGVPRRLGVGRSVDRGVDRAEAFDDGARDLERLLPPPVPEGRIPTAKA